MTKFFTSATIAALTVFSDGASAKDLPWTLPKYPSVSDYIRSDVAKLIYGEDRPKLAKMCEIRMKAVRDPGSGVAFLQKEASQNSWDAVGSAFVHTKGCQPLIFDRMSLLEKRNLMKSLQNKTFEAAVIDRNPNTGKIRVQASSGTNSAYWTKVHFESSLGETRMKNLPSYQIRSDVRQLIFGRVAIPQSVGPICEMRIKVSEFLTPHGLVRDLDRQASHNQWRLSEGKYVHTKGCQPLDFKRMSKTETHRLIQQLNQLPIGTQAVVIHRDAHTQRVKVQYSSGMNSAYWGLNFPVRLVW